jgi:type IV secretion system protein VirD4
LLVPQLTFWPGSCIAIDPKGELATLTAARRSAVGSHWAAAMDPGHGKVYVLDPYQRVTGAAVQFRAAFNPLADLDPETSQGMDLAWQIADSLIIQSTGEGAHWTQGARTFLRGLILYVAAAETEAPDSKTLIRVRQLLTQGRKAFEEMLAAMSGMGGVIGATADALSARPAVERWSVVSTCETQTAFIGQEMRGVLGQSDFRMEDLKSDRVTVYLCLPATRLATHGRWLRLLIVLAMEAMERTGPLQAGRWPVLFCLDEFAALGHMESIEAAAGQIAGFGVKLWPVIQDLTQLQRDYKAGWETFMGNAGLLTFFGNTDVTTTQHIATRLGDCEVIRPIESIAENWQTSSGSNRPDPWAALSSQGAGTSTVNEGRTDSDGRTMAQQVMRGPLMNSNEIAACFARDANNLLGFIARSDVPPFALYRCSYFSKTDEGLFGGLFDPVEGQDKPRVTAEERRARDAQGLWRVPVDLKRP